MVTLPPRPYTVSAAFARKRVLSAIVLFVVGAGGIGGSAWFTRHEAALIHDDQALWASGAIADGVQVAFTETSHEFILNEYELTNEYRDEQGGAHHGSLSFELLFASIANGEPVVLKYDRANPAHHTVSWTVQHLPARWGFVALMDLAFGGLFGAALVWLGVKQLRTLAHARLVAQRSDEITLELVSVKPVVVQKRHTANTYVYWHAGKQSKQQLTVAEVPLFTDEKQTHLVALVSPMAPDLPWIVRANNAPFV